MGADHTNQSNLVPRWQLMQRNLPSSSSPTLPDSTTTTRDAIARRQQFTIFKVPAVIRILDESSYEPQMVSIGPYHRGKPQLKIMEEQKWLYLGRFLHRDCNKSLKDYYSGVKSVVGRARSCYYPDDSSRGMTDDDFAEMMVLDGSFILELLLTSSERVLPGQIPGQHFDPNSDTLWTIASTGYDLLKLENQVPFFILVCLYNHLIQGKSGSPALKRLIVSFFKRGWESNYSRIDENPSIEEDSIYHLLHFCHFCVTNIQSHYKCHRPPTVPRVPAAQELLEAGAKFRAKNPGHLFEVQFTDGVLEMSPLVINDLTSSLFHNLVAFEQSCPETGGYLISYFFFIDNLVDTPADILLLRQAGVLMNQIGSDEKAVLLINNLCRYKAYAELPLYMLYEDVGKYCQSRWPKWRAKLVRDYFSSPWAFISLVAAIVLLVLTAGQMVFAVLSYVRSPYKFLLFMKF